MVRLGQACSTNRQKMARTRLEDGKPGYKINLIPTDFVKSCAQADPFLVLRKLTNIFFSGLSIQHGKINKTLIFSESNYLILRTKSFFFTYLSGNMLLKFSLFCISYIYKTLVFVTNRK